ncbi:MAG: CotH kinase family protein, partial [Verrucomicrobiales bacterium]|nr:CotH kinase family protein [Verrucomicrobiales bacterium]
RRYRVVEGPWTARQRLGLRQSSGAFPRFDRSEVHGEESLLSPAGFMGRGGNSTSRAKCRCSVSVFTVALFCILAVAFLGCGQQQGVTAPPRKGSPENRQTVLPASQLAAPEAQAKVPADLPNSRFPTYELRMSPRDLASLERTAFSNDTVPATFIADGKSYEGVKVRYRGAWARGWPKKPLKIFFPQDKPFEGQRRLNFNSCWRDPAFVREDLAYQIYAACDVPASRSRMVRLLVNGQFRGLYVEVEQPDKAFAKRYQLKGASVYKAVSRANQADERDHGRSEERYRPHYEKETQKEAGYGELQEFCQALARATNTFEFFTKQVDLEKYINYLAATTLLQHWDGYNKNHFLVYDGKGSKKWFVLPWDLDRTMGDHWTWSFDEAHLPILLGTRQKPGVTGWNRLQDRFFSDPTLRAKFADRLQELLEKEFTKEKLFPIVDGLEKEIGADVALDRRLWPNQQTPGLHSGIVQLKRFIERRRAYLLSELPKFRAE